jgi:glycosyltransferase involved in cell wall biosynthesis
MVLLKEVDERGVASGCVGEADTVAVARDVSVSVVIPARNEAANLPHVLTRLPAGVDEIILVDGHSIDDTVAVARAVCPRIRVIEQDGRGKGNALACGFDAAGGDIIVMLDADGSTDPREIPGFVDALLVGHDFAKGSRFAPGGGSTDITPIRRLGNRALNLLVNVLFRTRYTDLCYGYNAFWRDCLPDIEVTCDGFEVETLLNVRAAVAGLRVVEVPSVEHERLFGESNLRATRDGLRILRTIVSERLALARRRRSARRAAAAGDHRPLRALSPGSAATPARAPSSPPRRRRRHGRAIRRSRLGARPLRRSARARTSSGTPRTGR